jgi:hypothetical protein
VERLVPMLEGGMEGGMEGVVAFDFSDGCM